MHFLTKFYNKNLKYELINKFIYNKSNTVPKLKKIILNFGCKTADLKQLSSSLLAIELITNNKGVMTKTKKANILFKIRKGNPTGCKVILSKFNAYNFLSKLIIEIFPKLKNFSGFSSNKKIKINAVTYDLHETFAFKELENHYYLFNNLSKLNITIVTNTKNKEEMIFLLKSLQLPII
nr:ribosomal protein L5 [Gomphonema parvulum]